MRARTWPSGWRRWSTFKTTANGCTTFVRRQASCSNALLEGFGGKKGVLRKEGATLRKVFQDSDQMAYVEGVVAKAGYATELSSDEEHGFVKLKQPLARA